jgi:hypothetical protein
MNVTGNKCVECGGDTQPIQLVDRGQKNIHYELVYAAGGAKRSFGKGYDIEGKVAAEMCENCGRITLRAAPRD